MPAVAASDAAATFGELLRDHRRATGLTQEQLAERAGVSPRSISELERGGAHVPRRDTVALLARALGLVGPELEAFEVLVDRQRGPQPRFTLDQLPATPASQPTERAIQPPPEHNLPGQ
jgi:transcriptional regulator with XRE-family HTH domain